MTAAQPELQPESEAIQAEVRRKRRRRNDYQVLQRMPRELSRVRRQTKIKIKIKKKTDDEVLNRVAKCDLVSMKLLCVILEPDHLCLVAGECHKIVVAI